MLLIQIIAISIFLASGVLTAMIISARNRYLKTEVNEVIKDKVFLKIAVPRRNEKSPLSAEQLLTSLHGLGMNKAKSNDHFSLEIAGGPYGIHFIAVIDAKYKSFLENQIYAQYPEAQITHIRDYTESFSNSPGAIEVTELKLAKDYFLPIRTFANFEVDPLAGITGAMSNLQSGHEMFIQIVARPLSDSWQQKGRDQVNKMKGKTDKEGKAVPMEASEQEQAKLIEVKNGKPGFSFSLRLLVKAPDAQTATRLTTEMLAAYNQYKTPNLNSLVKASAPKLTFIERQQQKVRTLLLGKRASEKLDKFSKYKLRFLDEYAVGIINTEEYASLYHLPNKSVETPNISWARSKKLEYPLNLPTQDARILGETDYRGVHIKFGIKPLDRMRHMYVIGKTGVGKSTFIEGIITADIYDGAGLAVIDPHGETIDHILEMIPEHRKQDVVLFDPGDTAFPVGFNMLEVSEAEDKSLIADGIVGVFKKEFGNSWGPRLEYILTNAILTLLHCQNVSLLVLPRLLSDPNYRVFLLKQLKDPILMKFWIEEYEPMAKDPKRLQAEISSILNKVGRFTTNPMIRNIVGQITSTLDIKDIMDTSKILLVNLAQGKVGQENMALLGGMLVTRIYTNVTRRINQDSKDRIPFHLFIDEFQNFSNPTFEKILSEARKFALSLTIAHQFIDQIDEGVRNAVFGNVGTLINFSVGPKDAEYLSTEFAPYLLPEDLANLGKHEIVTKLSIDVAQSKPFTARTLMPNFPKTGLEDEIRDISRERYAKPREMMEQKLYKWAEQTYNKTGNLVDKEEEAAEREQQFLQREAARQARGDGGQQQYGNNNNRSNDQRGPRPGGNQNQGPRPNYNNSNNNSGGSYSNLRSGNYQEGNQQRSNPAPRTDRPSTPRPSAPNAQGPRPAAANPSQRPSGPSSQGSQPAANNQAPRTDRPLEQRSERPTNPPAPRTDKPRSEQTTGQKPERPAAPSAPATETKPQAPQSTAPAAKPAPEQAPQPTNPTPMENPQSA